ncbi:GNAT family N-acetyltransferase [Puerhibacterium puerhi]|uniref:GNAT family N-acetyltransferase n=1 Tax=Puerhibacterium puerhi TaxID=2692623 RepID=UPI0013598A11|nr:GNAT family N-acetyltransferase [Puerhibacterium puerhi]
MSVATWDFFIDPAQFLAVAGEHLAADPVLATVVSTTAQRLAARAAAGEGPPEHPHWFAVTRDRGDVVGVAMRTAPMPPHPLYLLPMPDDAAVALADALVARGELPGGANGALPAARLVAERVAARSGAAVTAAVRTRLFEVRTVVRPVRTPPGGPRLATTADLATVQGWFDAFGAEAARQAGRAPKGRAGHFLSADDVTRRVADGRVWLWEDAGETVHMTGVAGPALGVARVGPVFTPPAHRGRGYAGALVAHVSQALLDAGHRVCLFTDQANPVSNALYQRLGYERVVDTTELLIG